MSSIHSAGTIVIRRATDADIRALAHLAILDSREPLTGPVLIAEVDGALRAALDLHDGSVAADPFAPTAGLVELLCLHASRAPTASTGHGRLRNHVASFIRPACARA